MGNELPKVAPRVQLPSLAGKKRAAKAAPLDPVTIFDDLIPPYDGTSFSVFTQSAIAVSIRFKPDGTSMFYNGRSGNSVFQYTLSDPWDIASAVFASKSFSFAGQTGQSRGTTFKDDGTAMFMVETGDFVYQYTLSTAWDVSTASYSGNSFDAGTQASNPYGVDIGNDGASMILVDSTTGDVYQYTLSTPWDVSTASYSGNSFTQPSYALTSFGVHYSPLGDRIYVVSQSATGIFIYSLSTPWDISTAALVGSINVGLQETGPNGCTFRPDGSRMYMCGTATDTVYQYTIEAQ